MNELKEFKGNIIGFIRSGVHPDNVLAYQKILSEIGIEIFAVCEDKNEKEQYDPSIKVYCLEDWLKENYDKVNTQDLKCYQSKYSEYNLWEIYYTDRYIRYKYEYKDAVKLIILIVTFWENLLESKKNVYIVSDCIIGVTNFIGMIVGKSMKIPYISMPTGRYKQYFTYFSLDEGYKNHVFEQLLLSGCPITKEEIKEAEEYVESYIKNKKQPSYMDSTVMESRQLSKTLISYLKKIKNISYLWDSRFKNKYDIHLYKGFKQRLDPLIEAVRKPIIQKFFHEPDYNEDYILFPLHFQPEASTCVYARKYENQLYFIEQLTKSIPVGKILYVKEHFVRQGHKPLSFYKQVLKYPNVKLISPNVSTHDLIRHSSFLIVLTSTMAFEALMYGKSVFICGNCFFENFSGVMKIQDVYDEKQKFLNPPVQDRELYIKQMAYYLKTLQLCTMQEEPLHEESPETLLRIQKTSMDQLIRFIARLKKQELLEIDKSKL